MNTALHEALPKTKAAAKISCAAHYFPNEPCKNGHRDKRRTRNGACVVCEREYASSKRRLKGAKKRPSGRQESEEERRIRSKLRSRNRRKKDREKHLLSFRKWRLKNIERDRLRKQIWYQEHAEIQKAHARIRNLDNPDKEKAKKSKRRAKERNAEGSHTHADISRIRISQKDKCACCRIHLKGRGHLDHIVPLSRGGSNWPNNLQFLCVSCNLSKRARDPLEFMQSKGLLL